MLHDNKDPTTALFLSEGAASKAARMVEDQYQDRVSKAYPKTRTRSGERLGWCVVIRFKDDRPPTPLTNSDFERLVA